MVWNLDPRTPPREVGSVRGGAELALSASGRHLAVLERLELRIYDTETDRLVATHRLPKPRTEGWLHFESEGRPELLILVRENNVTWAELWGLDSTGTKLERLLQIPGFNVVLSHDWRRLGVLNLRYLEVIDRQAAENSYRVPVRSQRISRARFLSQGRLALAEGGPEENRPKVTVLSSKGVVLHTLAEEAARWFLGGEPRPGTLLLAAKTSRDEEDFREGRFTYSRHDWETRWVDLETGETLAVFPDRHPTTWRTAAGSPASQLLMTSEGLAERLDPETGRLVPIPLDDPQKAWR